MKRRVYLSLLEFVKHMPLPSPGAGKWPTRAECIQTIKSSHQYQALADVGMPLKQEYDRREVLEELLFRKVHEYILRIKEDWLQRYRHDCLNLDDLETRLFEDSGGIPDGYDMDAMGLFEIYYKRLEGNIVSSLLVDRKRYSEDDLELMVPFINGGDLYKRERVKNNYFQIVIKRKRDCDPDAPPLPDDPNDFFVPTD